LRSEATAIERSLLVVDRHPGKGDVGLTIANATLDLVDPLRLDELDLERRELVGEAAEDRRADLAAAVGGEADPQEPLTAA
jgi:hypothetical protein